MARRLLLSLIMMGKKSLNQYFLFTIVTAVAALAPSLSQASGIQTFVNGSAVSADETQDSYLKVLVDNLKTVEQAPEYQKALAELRASTTDCSSLKQWGSPDLSGNLVVKKNVEGEASATPGPGYSVSLSFPQVQSDTFNVPVQIFTMNPSLLTATSLAKFYRKTLDAVKSAARANRYVCSELAHDDIENDRPQSISSN